MRIWYDACTGKHIRYGTAIARKLRSLGHEMVLTTRKHPDTLALAKILGEEFLPVGEYDPATLYTRLKASAKRIIELAEVFKDNAPDIAIAHQSVELCRVAFGLGFPIILTADTPHAAAVNKLTIPFANTIVISEAIPKSFFQNYGRPKIRRFKGVDEVAWIQGFKPSRVSGFKKPLIVVRQMEAKAAYAAGKPDVTEKIAEKLTSLGNVLFLSRYDKAAKKGLIVVKEFVDSASLVADADLVVSEGGTISREAALQGVPSIVLSDFGQTYVNEYLMKKHFPLFVADSSEAVALAEKYLGKKWDVKEKLAKLENPLDLIASIIAEKDFS